MNYLARYFPWLVILAATGYIAWTLVPPRDEDGQYLFTEVARLPVVKDGRIKPLDTLARNSLLVISNRQSVVDEDGKKVPLMKWLLDVMTSGDGYEQRKEFRITSPPVLRALHLEKTPDSHYSLSDIRDASALFVEVVLNSGPLDNDKPPREFVAWFIRQVLGIEDFDLEKAKKQLAQPSVREAFYRIKDLGVDIQRFVSLKRFSTPYRVFRIENDQVLGLLQLKPRSGLRYTFDELYPGLRELFDQVKRVGPIKEKDRDLYSQKLMELYERLQLYVGLARLEAPTLRLIPPLAGEAEDEWRTLVKAREREDRLHTRFLAVASSAVGGPVSPSLEQKRSRKFYPAFQDFEILLTTYQKGDIQGFNRQLLSYRDLLKKQMPDKVDRAAFETRFNEFDPFYHCALLCFVSFLLACFAWLGWSEPLNRSASGLATLVLVVLAGSLIARMFLMDRWWVFVTNLYSSAVFIGEACIAFGLVLEKIYRNGIGNAIAGLVGFLALILAPQLVSPGEVDTMGNLRAVLDTNFWLATHVTCVSLGYMSTFLAGFLGMIFILRGVFTRSLDRQTLKTMGQMIYGVLCFALLFSFTGTVLGGIWADQSWGRFWGWDPKENGALLIVLMNALILHARWAGLVQQRGMAVLAVIGNMVTAWSWFGTNQLGVGLHAYGFNNTLATILVVFWGVMAGFLVLGLLPRSLWRSFAK